MLVFLACSSANELVLQRKSLEKHKPTEHKNHHNTEVQGEGFKEKKNKFETPFYLFFSLSSHIQWLFVTFSFLPGRLGTYLWLFFLKYWYRFLKISSKGIPESWDLKKQPKYWKTDSHIPCASNTVWIYFMYKHGNISQLQYSMVSTAVSGHLIVFALHLLQNKEAIFFTVYE